MSYTVPWYFLGFPVHYQYLNYVARIIENQGICSFILCVELALRLADVLCRFPCLVQNCAWLTDLGRFLAQNQVVADVYVTTPAFTTPLFTPRKLLLKRGKSSLADLSWACCAALCCAWAYHGRGKSDVELRRIVRSPKSPELLLAAYAHSRSNDTHVVHCLITR